MYRFAAFVAVAALTLSVARAEATTVTEKTLANLCSEADMVFVGKVVSVESHWQDASKHGIETAVTFSVVEPLYGTSGADVTLQFSGGEVDGLREVVAGMPQFTVGDEVMIFASNKPLVSPIIGFHQGYFRIADGPSGRVMLNSENRPVTGFSGQGLSFGKPQDGIAAGMPLDAFLQEVKRQLGDRKASP